MAQVGCTCAGCFAHYLCKCTLLFASLFRQDLRVPADYIAATVSLRKQCKSIKGTTGRKRMRIIKERKCDEKKIDSKVWYLTGTMPPKSPFAQEPVIPDPNLS